jgi:multidrug resistance efflux pump
MPDNEALAGMAAARAKADALRAEMVTLLENLAAARDTSTAQVIRDLRRLEAIRQQLDLTGQ